MFRGTSSVALRSNDDATVAEMDCCFGFSFVIDIG